MQASLAPAINLAYIGFYILVLVPIAFALSWAAIETLPTNPNWVDKFRFWIGKVL